MPSPELSQLTTAPLAVEFEKVFVAPAVRQISVLPFSIFATQIDCAAVFKEQTNVKMKAKKVNNKLFRHG